MPDPRATREEDDAHREHEHHRRGEIGLQRGEQREQTDDEEKGEQALRQAAHPVALFHDQHRGPGDHRNLRELRRLQRAAHHEAA